MPFTTKQIEALIEAGQAQLVKDVREIARRLSELPEAYDDTEIRLGLADAIASMPKMPEPYDDSELKKSIAAVSASIPEIPEPPAPYDDSELKESINGLKNDLIATAGEIRFEAEQAERIAKETAADTVNAQMLINAQPVEQWTRGVDYPAGRKVTHHGGTWEAVKQTAAEPGQSSGWLLVADGIKQVSVNGDSLQVETASGETFRVDDLKGEAGSSIKFKGKYLENVAYSENEIAVTAGAAWISKCNDNQDKPPSDNWGCIAQRGPRGRRGEKGDKPDATEIYPLLIDVFDQHYERLAHETAKAARVPATPEEVEPVAKEAIEQMLPAYHTALRRDLNSHIKKQFEELNIPGVPFRGLYSTTTSYATGEIVRYRNGLYIATANSINEIPDGADRWQLMLEAELSGRGGIVSQADLVALITEVNLSHVFETTETAVTLTSTPTVQRNTQIIDTAWGPETGVRFLKDGLSLSSNISFYMLESGAQTQCLISFKATTFDLINDTANFVDTDFYAFQSSSSNEGTLNLNPSAVQISKDSVFVLTTQKTEPAPDITFEADTVLGRAIPALKVEMVALQGTINND